MKSRARYEKVQYRARGVYSGETKPTWVTKVWRANKIEAVDDLRMFATGRYSQKKIVKRTWK
jgi:hypothetical protein